jgi:hypothetical protein
MSVYIVICDNLNKYTSYFIKYILEKMSWNSTNTQTCSTRIFIHKEKMKTKLDKIKIAKFI